MPRFVVLHHVTPPGSSRASHWDLMFEMGAALRTWALPLPPEPGQSQVVESLPDHRLAYLDYEGPISGGRGDVSRWDAGSFEPISHSDSRLEVMLLGGKLLCRATLVRLEETPEQWRLSLDST